MPSYGYRGDVNNSIPYASAYPGLRALGDVPIAASRSNRKNNSGGETAASSPDAVQNQTVEITATGVMGKPSSWWLMFLIVFVGFAFLARRYGGSEADRFSNVKLSVYNGIFLTFYIVLILNLLKVLATRFKIPGVSELILAA